MLTGKRYSSSVAATLKRAIGNPESNAQRAYEQQHQRVIGLTSIPTGAPKQARDLAASEPWRGDESVHAANQRMLEDSHKRIKVSSNDRLLNARENALDYKFNGAEGDTFRDRLKKPRTSTSGLSGGGIESIAMQQIEDAIARGQFADLPRGKPLKRDSHLANPYIDTTEYILNNIIKKQGAAPPWISKQQDMHGKIAQFRARLLADLTDRLVHRYTEEHPRVSASRLVSIALASEHKDTGWEQRHREFHRLQIEHLNRTIRGYNLEAPQTARTGYLAVDSELERAYAGVNTTLGKALHKFMGIAPAAAEKSGLHKSLPPVESSDKHYGLKQLFRDLLSRRSGLW